VFDRDAAARDSGAVDRFRRDIVVRVAVDIERLIERVDLVAVRERLTFGGQGGVSGGRARLSAPAGAAQ